MAKFKSIIDNATRADGIVKEKFENNRDAMLILGKPIPEIQAAIPAAGAQAAAVSGSQVEEEGREGERKGDRLKEWERWRERESERKRE